MNVSLPAGDIESIRAHAEATWPEECCGILAGRGNERGDRDVFRIYPAANSASAGRASRYRIDQGELSLNLDEMIPSPKRLDRALTLMASVASRLS